MIKKEHLPLALLYVKEQEKIEGRTRLQKMVFLMQQHLGTTTNSESIEQYEFIAYDYGPFSKELYSDIDSLKREFVQEQHEEYDNGKEKYDYEMTDDGKSYIENQLSGDDSQEIINLAEDIKSEYNEELLSTLIDDVYSQYPEFAENSIY